MLVPASLSVTDTASRTRLPLQGHFLAELGQQVNGVIPINPQRNHENQGRAGLKRDVEDSP